MVTRAAVWQAGLHGDDGSLESVLRARFARMGTQNSLWQRDTFTRLLLHLHAQCCDTVLRNPAFIDVLANISVFGNKIVREPEAWVKDSFVAENQLASLIRHCFARYDVPPFLENVFAGSSRIHMLWYIQLGRGDSVQQLCGFPVTFTKRMAHEFRHTPGNSLSVGQAIRRAQALGYGACAHTAGAMAWSCWSENFDDEEFRATAIRFIAAEAGEPAFDVLQQVLEYLTAMRREQPAYSMRGRTWAALARQAAEWHAEQSRRAAAEDYTEWDNGLLRNFSVENELAIFSIVQLTNSEALYEEGEEMCHCVADYAYDCSVGDSAIFSVRKQVRGAEGFTRLATVEVRPQDGAIVQAKAVYNQSICVEAAAIIQQWAAAEGLTQEYEEEFHAHNAGAAQAAFHGGQENDGGNALIYVKLALFLMYFLFRACNN